MGKSARAALMIRLFSKDQVCKEGFPWVKQEMQLFWAMRDELFREYTPGRQVMNLERLGVHPALFQIMRLTCTSNHYVENSRLERAENYRCQRLQRSEDIFQRILLPSPVVARCRAQLIS